MKKYSRVIVVVIILCAAWAQRSGVFDSSPPTAATSEALAAAIRDHQSGVQVTGEGTVTKILDDDDEGSRHQRFILSISDGHTLLIAHNIDLAPRVSPLERGDTVAFNGVYEWNKKGGVVHWTHHDPGGRHEPGWLKHNGRTFQ